SATQGRCSQAACEPKGRTQPNGHGGALEWRKPGNAQGERLGARLAEPDLCLGLGAAALQCQDHTLAELRMSHRLTHPELLAIDFDSGIRAGARVAFGRPEVGRVLSLVVACLVVAFGPG